MQLADVLLLVGLALLLRLAPPRPRRWLVFAASIGCLYWLQPGLPVRYLSFWLPTATLFLIALSWLLTRDPSQGAGPAARQDGAAGALLVLLPALLGLTRYLGGGDWLLDSPPPPVGTALAGLALAGALLLGLWLLLRKRGATGWAWGLGMLLMIALLVALKTPPLALEAARILRQLSGQNPALAGGLDVRWLGFSYIAFRLVHTLRDRQTGRLPETGLRDYLTYVVFFPSLAAGPIDRLERWKKDWEDDVRPPLTEAGRRLVIGLVKKFAVADTLALVALNPDSALQVHEPGWMWLLLYVYALQIYFDFSGYTDIAVAAGLLLGVKLPENFNAPYLKPNLTQFWNSWHMSLTQWFRGYFFNPCVRWLRTGRLKLSAAGVLLVTQVATFVLIGLWHGVTVNFVLWGLWHGVGLFAQNRWTEATRGWFAAREFSPFARGALQAFSILLTFHYVVLGWVFFLLPTPGMAVAVFKTLFGG